MKVTILGSVLTEVLQGKKGEYTKHTQEARFETEGFRMTSRFDVKAPDKGYAPGEYTCDVEAQMQPGRFGPELPRYLTLTPVAKRAAA